MFLRNKYFRPGLKFVRDMNCMERMGFENLNCSSLRGKFLEKILIFKGARALSRIATEEEVCKKKAVVPMRRD